MAMVMEDIAATQGLLNWLIWCPPLTHKKKQPDLALRQNVIDTNLAAYNLLFKAIVHGRGVFAKLQG